MTPPAPSPATPDTGLARTRIWDLPTRLFHGLLAVTVTGVLVTGWTGVMASHLGDGYHVIEEGLSARTTSALRMCCRH